MKASIDRIASDTRNPNISAELQSAIRNRVAFLFVRDADGFVLKPVVEKKVTGVLVWAGWGDDGAPARHLPEVKHLARMIGARWLRFHSTRRGWLKVAPKMGWVRQPDDDDGMLVFQINL
ncbi:hypothetical protein [Aeromonas eucrenophila]|uniref:Uncharacterized protein n=1 Tax=Aeromonas eucrenophila TaxID=649 RepID=A0ABW0YD07_9GAMM|nr:hypothetical protein [Aeromonas eucrenophila]